MKKQLELPFTKRGRRDLRRLNGVNKRAFRCSHKNYREEPIYKACDNSEARSMFLAHLRELDVAVKFTDIRAKRAPEHDEAKP